MDGRNCRYVEAQVIRFWVLDDSVWGVIDKAQQALAKEIHADFGTIEFDAIFEVRGSKFKGPAKTVDDSLKSILVPNLP